VLRYFGSGRQLVAIGLLHQAVGFALGAPVLGEIARDGFANAIEPAFDRMAIFWFLWFGWLLLLLGGAVHALEGRGGVPRWLTLGIGAMALGGGIALPASGFWLALVPVGILIARGRGVQSLR
jgi:hypothetical protein